MTVLKNGEVQALAHVYFLEEAGRTSLTAEAFLSYIEQRWPPHGRDYAARLLELGFIREVTDPERSAQRRIAITTEGTEWFERNVEGWRACNQYVVRPKFDTQEPQATAKPSLANRLRDPLITGAAIAGAAVTLLLSWIIR